MLGNPTHIDDNEDDIETVLANFEIDDGLFTNAEYQKAKRSIVEGKASGEHGILPEVLKRCDLDDRYPRNYAIQP